MGCWRSTLRARNCPDPSSPTEPALPDSPLTTAAVAFASTTASISLVATLADGLPEVASPRAAASPATDLPNQRACKREVLGQGSTVNSSCSTNGQASIEATGPWTVSHTSKRLVDPAPGSFTVSPQLGLTTNGSLLPRQGTTGAAGASTRLTAPALELEEQLYDSGCVLSGGGLLPCMLDGREGEADGFAASGGSRGGGGGGYAAAAAAHDGSHGPGVRSLGNDDGSSRFSRELLGSVVPMVGRASSEEAAVAAMTAIIISAPAGPPLRATPGAGPTAAAAPAALHHPVGGPPQPQVPGRHVDVPPDHCLQPGGRSSATPKQLFTHLFAQPPRQHPHPPNAPGRPSATAVPAGDFSDSPYSDGSMNATTVTTATANLRRPTMIRGLTRDSFQLTNTTGGGLGSGFMMRTATAREELLHTDTSWPPFHMGNPLQVRIGSLLGRGGCGSVYMGEWHGRPVAVKVVQQVVVTPPSAAAPDPAPPTPASGGAPTAAAATAAAAPPPLIAPLIDYLSSSSGYSHAAAAAAGSAAGTRTAVAAAVDGAGTTGPAATAAAIAAPVSRAPRLPDAHAFVKRLRHPNVLRTHAYALLSLAPQLGGVLPARHEHHVVLELCDGGSLRAWLDGLYLSTTGAEAATATVGAAAALTAPAGDAACAEAVKQALDRAQAHIGGAGGGGGGGDPLAVYGGGGRGPKRCALAAANADLTNSQPPKWLLKHQPQQKHPQQQLQHHHPENQHPQNQSLEPVHDHQRQDQQPQQPPQSHPDPSPQAAEPADPEAPPSLQEAAPAAAAAADPGVPLSPAAAPEGKQLPLLTVSPPQAQEAAALPPPDLVSASVSRQGRSVPGEIHGNSRSHITDSTVADTVASGAVSQALSRLLPGLTPAQSQQLQLLGLAWVADGEEAAMSAVVGAGSLATGGSADGVAAEHGVHGGGERLVDGGAWMEVPALGAAGDGSCVSVGAMSDPSGCPTEGPAAGLPLGSARITPAAAAALAASTDDSRDVRQKKDGSGEDVPPAAAVAAPPVAEVKTEACPPAVHSGHVGSGGGGGCCSNSGDLKGDGVGGALQAAHPVVTVVSTAGCTAGHGTSSCDIAKLEAARASPSPPTAELAKVWAGPMLSTRCNANGSVGSYSESTFFRPDSCTIGGLLIQQQYVILGDPTDDAMDEQDPSVRHKDMYRMSGSAGSIGGAGGGGLCGMMPCRDDGRLQQLDEDSAEGQQSRASGLLTTTNGSATASATATATATSQPTVDGAVPSAQGGPPPPPPPLPQPLLAVAEPPQSPPLYGELETGAALTALLNRRAQGMVNSILRAAAAAGGAGAGGGVAGGAGRGGAGAAAGPLELPPEDPMQPSQLQHLVTALDCLAEISSGLSYLHAVGMVHGDVKSGNVLLKLDRQHPRGFVLKLADFGFSRVLEHGSHTYLSRPSGTLAYLSPELVKSYRQSAAADQYAFGLLVWEVVTTQPLFRGLHTSQLLYAKTHNADWRYLQWPSWCPHDVRSLARRCADFEPAARITAAEAREQLEALRAQYRDMLAHRHSAEGGGG